MPCSSRYTVWPELLATAVFPSKVLPGNCWCLQTAMVIRKSLQDLCFTGKSTSAACHLPGRPYRHVLCSPEFLLQRRNVVFSTNMCKSQTPSRPHATGDTTTPDTISRNACLQVDQPRNERSVLSRQWFQTKLVLCSQRLVGSLEFGWSPKRRKLLFVFGCILMARFSPKRNRTPRPRYHLFCLCSFEGERSRKLLRMVSAQN